MALYSWASPPNTPRVLNFVARAPAASRISKWACALRLAKRSTAHSCAQLGSKGLAREWDFEGCRIPRTHQQRVVVVDGPALDVDHCARPVRPQVHLQKHANSVKLQSSGLTVVRKAAKTSARPTVQAPAGSYFKP